MKAEKQGYQEHHFQNVEDIGVAWNDNRVWVCMDGACLFVPS